MSRRALTAELLFKVDDLFTRRGWPRTCRHPEASFGDSRDCFCRMLEKLTDEERDLVLTIAEDFLYCGLSDYEEYFVKACQDIELKHLSPGPDLFFVPMKNPTDRGSLKSSDMMAHIARGLTTRVPLFSGKTIRTVLDIATDNSFNRRTNATVALIDDFIGSGETAVAAIAEYHSKLRKADDHVFVLSLVSLRTGNDAVLKSGVPHFSADVRPKGISESLRLANPAASLDVMRRLEKRIGVRFPYALGFEESEGLESMLRTPDNTLPIFWMTNPMREAPWPAPFAEIR